MTAAARLLGAFALVAGFAAAVGVGALLVASVVTVEVRLDQPLAAATLAVAIATCFAGAAALFDR